MFCGMFQSTLRVHVVLQMTFVFRLSDVNRMDFGGIGFCVYANDGHKGSCVCVV